MRRLLLLALLGCGTESPPSGGASLVLDIPNGLLDPKGYTTVEITLHQADGDVVRSAAIGTDGRFDLGELDPRTAVSVEAALRDDSGAVVGYGRTAAAADLAAGATITVPVRRPMIYFAGPSLTFTPPTTIVWHGARTTFSDLSTNAALDGSTKLAENAVLVIAAGPQLFAIDQPVNSVTGALTGTATVRGVSTRDHVLAAPFAGSLLGVVRDGAGSDDGGTLVVGTATKLYAIDARPDAGGTIRELASGDFSRVAIVTDPTGGVGAVAIRNRVTTTGVCNPTAELWWIANTGSEVIDAQKIATGGFSDVASDGGRAWYVDACKGEFGEALTTGVRVVRSDLGLLGKPTALAVSNGQAWVGIERAATLTLSLAVVPVESATAMPRTLWSEVQDQVVSATQFPGVERRLAAQSAKFMALEIGAGGDYVAATIAGEFLGVRVSPANFPEMTIETEELRVFDAASGGSVQRYRSWCDGSFTTLSVNDIDEWSCTTSTGQTGPRDGFEHRINSMTFQFGKK